MKRLSFFITVIIANFGFSQVVDGINYQAVALDANGREIPGIDINGNVIFESSFNVRFTVRSNALNGPIEYQETHTDVLTDNFGLFSLTIGHGQITSSSNQSTLNDVNWGGDMHFLEVELDLEKTGEFKTMSNQQLMAVPYAFYALNADKVDWGNIENIPADIADGDDTGVSGTDDQNLTLTGTTLEIEDGNTVDLSTLQDGTGTDDQNLTLTGTTLAIEDGNTVDLSTLQDGTGTDDQNLTLTGTTLAIEDGNTVDLSTLQDGTGTDDQNLTLTGTTLAIEDGNTVDLSTLQDGTGTDDQNLTLTGTTLAIEDGNTVDLSTLQDGTGTDDQNLTLTGTTLAIEDGNTVDLSTLQDGTGTDDQNLTLTGTTLAIEDGNTVDLSILQDGVDDADNDPTNEIDHDWYIQGTTDIPSNIDNEIFTNSNVLINGRYGDIGPAASTFLEPNNFRGLVIKNSDMNSGYKSVSLDLRSLNTDASIIGGNEISSNGANGYFAIETRNAETLVERFRINSQGNVGINVSNPSLLDTRFQVDGPVRFDNLTASDNTETSALLMNPSNRLVTRTLDPVAFNGEIDGDITNEIQDLDLTSNTLSLSNSVPTVDLSPYAQDFIVYGNNFIGLTNSPGVVNLAPYLDNTDNQNLTAATLTGNVLQIDIQNGTSASVNLSAISDSKWTRNSGNGFLYPTTISDKIGIGTTAPTQQLQITGGSSAWSLSPTAANVDNLYLHDVSGADGLDAIGGSISFSGPGNGAGGAERRHAAIAGIQTDAFENDYIGLAFFTHFDPSSSGNLQESMRLTHNGKLELNDLSGTGNRMVIADANGRLSTQAIPTGAGNDNLGNHLATMDLDLSQNSLENTHFVSYHDDWAGGADTKTSVHTTRINIPAKGTTGHTAWQDNYIAFGYKHQRTNATTNDFVYPGVTLKDASLIDDWMVVLLGGSGGDGFGGTDIGEYRILNFSAADVTGLVTEWCLDGYTGIGVDNQVWIEDADWVGSRVILLYKKNQTTATKYAPMYRITFIVSGDINTDNIDIITTVEATYHDVD